MNPQRVELVPHSALSARLRWTRFLLQSLWRPLGYTECPHLKPASPMAEHNASKVTSQQRRGFHATCHMHYKQMRAKKGNEFPNFRWTRFLMQWLRRPLGCTEWRDTTINYLLVRHISSSSIRQQRRGLQFCPTGWWC